MKTKFNLDREPLESDYIESKRDFNKVVKGYKASQYPVWKRPWFYGPTGAAAFALILSMTIFNENELNEQNPTLTSSVTAINDLEDTPCVHPPSEETDLAFRVFTIDANKNELIELPSGTTIEIPANSLQAEGKVDIKVREFPNKAAVFLAGVPMDHESEAFESAGMIEIRAFQNDEIVAIKDDAAVKVELVQTKDGTGFGFWYLDETAGVWTPYPAVQTTENLDLDLVITKCLSHLKKVETALEQVETKVEAVLKQPTSSQLLPNPKAKKLVVDFDVAEFPEFKSMKGIEFEYLNYSTELSKTLKSETWTAVELQKSKNYLVEFSNSRTSIAVPVKPVLSGQELVDLQNKLEADKEQRQQELAELKKQEAQLKKERLQLKNRLERIQSDMKSALAQESNTSSEREKYMNRQSARNMVNASTKSEFSTNRWGLFNCDQPIPYPKSVPVEREFVDANGAKINVQHAYVFDLKKDVRYTFGVGARGLNEIAWNKSNSTMIVLDDFGQMYVAQKVNELDTDTKIIRFQALDLANLDAEQLEKILNEEMVLA